MKNRYLILYVIFLITSVSLQAGDMQFSGEIKANSAFSTSGGIVFDQYRLTNMGLWRLGNEGTGVDANLGFRKTWISETGVTAIANIGIKAETDDTVDWVSAAFKLTEANVEIQGLKFSPGTTVWAGKSEDLKAVHIMDWCYRKFGGFGAGIKNLRLGDLTLDVNFYDVVNSGWPKDTVYDSVSNPATAGYYNIMTLQSKVGIPLGFGLLEVEAAGHLVPSADQYLQVEAEELAGWGVQGGIYLHTDKFFMADGFSDWAVQAGYGLPTGDQLGQNQYLNNQYKEAFSTRFVYTGLFESKTFDLMTAAAFQFDMGHKQSGPSYDKNADNRIWITAGLRPVYNITRNLAIQAEYGFEYLYDETRGGAQTPTKVLAGDLHKFTVAGALTLGENFWARPQIRIFGTFAMWDPELNGLSLNYDSSNPISTDATFGDDRNMAFTFGINLETWF